MATIRDLLSLSHLLTHSDSAPRDAELLLAHCLEKDRAYLYAWPEREIDAQSEARFRQLLARRGNGEPVAYLLGVREFWSLPLAVENCTLIPRPDTERLVEIALECAPADAADVLDLGTGSGAIALALAHEQPRWRVLGVDVEPAAVALAQRNARALNLPNAAFLPSNWFDAVPAQRFDLIVSNPPYIAAGDPHLAQGDVRFEPRRALVAERDGMAAIAAIAQRAAHYLQPRGWLLFEHGFAQGPAVRTLLAGHGFEAISTWNDWGGNERVTGARRPQNPAPEPGQD